MERREPRGTEGIGHELAEPAVHPRAQPAEHNASTTTVESLLITAAELHIRADLGVVDAAETTLTTDPAPVSEQASSGLTPPQSAAG
jgi:hypothetical protein